ncbi:MAG: SgcJ/EcaC family oxidoreductase [Pseudomonadota bacterium]
MGDLEIQISRVIERYKTAVMARNVDTFIALYSQDVRVFDAWTTWSYNGATAWREAVRQWFTSTAEETVEVSAEDIQIMGGQDVAVLSAIITYASLAPDGKKLRAMQNRLTWALARQGGVWQIVHEHTSAPIDFDGMRAILTRAA